MVGPRRLLRRPDPPYTLGGTEQTFPLRIAPPMPSFPVAHSVQIDEKTVPASPLFAMFDARAHHEEQPFARHDRGRHVGCGGRPRERRQIGTGLARKRPARAKMCSIACRYGIIGPEKHRRTEPPLTQPQTKGS